MAKVLRKKVEVEIPMRQGTGRRSHVIDPGERIPTDGVIIEGSSSIDESAVTGESIPVDKTKENQVIGATINKNENY